MLLPNDINPVNTEYFNGALALQELENHSKAKVDILDLYRKIKKNHDISMQAYILSLDWLFILGSIKLSKDGKIEKCF